jgi:NTP pyrophosphatase (non-canonical NTP hydrolase)
MPRHERSLPISNATLKTLMHELGDECSRVLELMHQLQVSNLQDDQKADILAEILASVIHLHTHCDEDLQEAISDELDSLPE